MFDFVGHLRIGSKNLLINLWALSTLQLGGGGGGPKKVCLKPARSRGFEVEDFIFLSTLLLLLLSLG